MWKRPFRFFLFLSILATALDAQDKNVFPLDPPITINIPMRDGHLLEADVYLPPSGEKNLPSLLVRSPYGKKGFDIDLVTSLAKDDYIVIIQETRSAQDTKNTEKSGNATLPFITDHEDGIDTISWLAMSEWGNGKIGTAGTSALGITQHFLAPFSPKELTAQYIRFGAANLYRHVMFQSGQFCKELVEGWLSRHASDPQVYAFIMNRAKDTEFWNQFDSLRAVSAITTPAVHLGGWFDVFLGGTLEAFCKRHQEGAEGAKNLQKLVIGPWSHFWPRHQNLGDFAVPENGQKIPEHLSEKAWFNYHLKGKEPDMATIPAVHYYLMGPLDGTPSLGNCWKTAENWPIPAVKTPLYLGEKNSLAALPPISSEKKIFSFSPEDPVETYGGRNLFIASGPKDQKKIENRDDVILFTSKPLEEDLVITGPVEIKLFISTDSDDAAVAVRLCDVYPDGKSILITDGLSRIHTADQSINEITVDLLATSQLFAKGHKIRVSLAGSNFPRFEKSKKQNTTTVYFSQKNPSHLILPVINGI